MRLNEGAWIWPELSSPAPPWLCRRPVRPGRPCPRHLASPGGLVGHIGDKLTLVPSSDGFDVHGSAGTDGLRLLDTSLGLSAGFVVRGPMVGRDACAGLEPGPGALEEHRLGQGRGGRDVGQPTSSVGGARLGQHTNATDGGAGQLTSFRDPEQLRGRVTLNQAPAAWGQAWVPEDWLSFAGQVSGQVGVGGSISAPSLQGGVGVGRRAADRAQHGHVV